MLKDAIAIFQNIYQNWQLEIDDEAIADAIWLAMQMEAVKEHSSESNTAATTSPSLSRKELEPTTSPTPLSDFSGDSETPPSPLPEEPEESIPSPVPTSVSNEEEPEASFYASSSASNSIPIKIPKPPDLQNQLDIARSLRPLKRKKVPSSDKSIIDEEATTESIAEQGIWMPVLKPAPERWLDVALVVEYTNLTPIWKPILDDFIEILKHQGAFRSLWIWYLQADETGKKLKLHASSDLQQPRYPKELLDAAQRKLILLASDCISSAWRNGSMLELLDRWQKDAIVTLLNPLPERLWERTALGYGLPTKFSSPTPGTPTADLKDNLSAWERQDLQGTTVKLPIVTFEASLIARWSHTLVSTGNQETPGFILDNALESAEETSEPNTAEERVARFRATASPTALRLAGLLATVPVSLPVVRLIQQTMLPESDQGHFIEVFASDLFQPAVENSNKPEYIDYEFVDGVRELLLESVPGPEAVEVIDTVSAYIAKRLGLAPTFAAFLEPLKDGSQKESITPFARITIDVLKRLGEKEYKGYKKVIEDLEKIFISRDEQHTEKLKFAPNKVTTQNIITHIVNDNDDLDVESFRGSISASQYVYRLQEIIEYYYSFQTTGTSIFILDFTTYPPVGWEQPNQIQNLFDVSPIEGFNENLRNLKESFQRMIDDSGFKVARIWYDSYNLLSQRNQYDLLGGSVKDYIEKMHSHPLLARFIPYENKIPQDYLKLESSMTNPTAFGTDFFLLGTLTENIWQDLYKGLWNIQQINNHKQLRQEVTDFDRRLINSIDWEYRMSSNYEPDRHKVDMIFSPLSNSKEQWQAARKAINILHNESRLIENLIPRNVESQEIP